MRWLANLVYLVVGLLYVPVLFHQMVFQKKNRRGWVQRFGFVPRRDPSRPRIWVHAVSLGEMNATRSLVNELRARRPDCDIVFSTTTDTGYARGVELYGADHVFRFPLDFSFVIRRALRRVAPAVIVLMELEVWYNLVTIAKRGGIPVAIVNGRLTEKSARRFGRLAFAARRMFSALDWVGAQDQTTADRFARVGVPLGRIDVIGSVKWDTAHVSDRVEGDAALAAALGLPEEQLLWVCGSTGDGEEELLLDTYRRVLAKWPELIRPTPSNGGNGGDESHPPILALVPRKPERFNEVAALIERSGFRCVRRSVHRDGGAREGVTANEVILGDTMGELRKFYALADVVFVGRSLVPMGGSDPMEVAALGKAMVVGPHTENFAQPVELLSDANAIRVVDGTEELPFVVGTLLSRPHVCGKLGQAARAVVLAQQGATRRAVDHLRALLPPLSQGPAASD